LSGERGLAAFVPPNEGGTEVGKPDGAIAGGLNAIDMSGTVGFEEAFGEVAVGKLDFESFVGDAEVGFIKENDVDGDWRGGGRQGPGESGGGGTEEGGALEVDGGERGFEFAERAPFRKGDVVFARLDVVEFEIAILVELVVLDHDIVMAEFVGGIRDRLVLLVQKLKSDPGTQES